MITNATTTTSTPTTQPIAIATGENLPPPPPEPRPDLDGASRSSRRLRCATLSLAIPCETVAGANHGTHKRSPWRRTHASDAGGVRALLRVSPQTQPRRRAGRLSFTTSADERSRRDSQAGRAALAELLAADHVGRAAGIADVR